MGAYGLLSLFDGVALHVTAIAVGEAANLLVARFMSSNFVGKWDKMDQSLVQISLMGLVSNLISPLSHISMMQRAESAVFLSENRDRISQGECVELPNTLSFGSCARRVSVDAYSQQVALSLAILILQAGAAKLMEPHDDPIEE